MKLLLVDDEEYVIESIKRNLDLTETGVNEVYTAFSVQQAKNIMGMVDIDIVISDIVMPGGTGFDFVEWVRKEELKVQVIFLTSYAEFDYARKAVRLGVSDYILKPVDPSEFKETITRVIQELEAERVEKNMKKKSMQQMREHALYQIVNGVNVAEVLEKSGGVLIKSDVDCFCRILILETDDDFFGKNGVDLQERILAKKMKEVCASEAFLYLNLTPQQSIILLKDRSIAPIEFANKLLDQIKEEYENSCTASILQKFHVQSRLFAQWMSLRSLWKINFIIRMSDCFTVE